MSHSFLRYTQRLLGQPVAAFGNGGDEAGAPASSPRARRKSAMTTATLLALTDRPSQTCAKIASRVTN